MFKKTGVDVTKAKSMFDYINNHYKYWTLNSWNTLKSIANNVKLYNLALDGNYDVALKYLCDPSDVGGLQAEIYDMIKFWEEDHPGYAIGFNGRSSGYLVLYNANNNLSVVPHCLEGYDSYDEWKRSIRENVKDYLRTLKDTTRLIQSFDRLCDQLRDLVNEYSKMDYSADKAAAQALA